MTDQQTSKRRSFEVVPYSGAYREAFYRLNKAWIDQYFTMEPIDEEVLSQPEKYILEPGGSIWVALVDGQVAGVCALMPEKGTGDLELTKMGVDPSYQGLGIGFALGQAILEAAREQGAKRVFLESNTILGPAIGLYRKLGFQEFSGRNSPYARCNIQMEVHLESP